MPILFIHGVNTRKSDEDYFRNMAARKKMFEELVVPVAKSKYPGFGVADDAYWGDLGVRFRWGLGSVPASGLQSLGTPDTPLTPTENTELLSLLASVETAPSEVQSLGAAESAAVRTVMIKKPGDLVRAVYAPQVLSYEPINPNPGPPLGEDLQKKLKTQGEELASLMIAAETVARQADKDSKILSPAPGETVLDRIGQKAAEELKKMSPVEPESDIQGLGWKDKFQWATGKISSLVKQAKSTAEKVKNLPARGASLLVLKASRDDVSRKGLRFLGDVFVYLHHGRAIPPSITSRVVDAVKGAAATAATSKEPLVVVTHSFGSEILFDSLISGRLSDVFIDLWVAAGAQTSLFAEMALFEKSDQAPPVDAPKPLGKPANVKRWINFYDAADVLSYLHEPVFGKNAVTDIELRDGANLGSAHGHYFLTVSFYERIAQELGTLIGAQTTGASI